MAEDLATLVAGAHALGIALNPEQQARFVAYGELLLEWNEHDPSPLAPDRPI